MVGGRGAFGCFLIALSQELGACKLSPRDNNDLVKRDLPSGSHIKYAPPVSIFPGVSWGVLTSSKLKAQGYEAASTCAREKGSSQLTQQPIANRPPTTDYRLLITKKGAAKYSQLHLLYQLRPINFL